VITVSRDLSLSKIENPLAFWKDKQEYPELAKLACQYLQIPASRAQ